MNEINGIKKESQENNTDANTNKDLNEIIPIVLCGNKCDLESERQIQTAEAQKLAEEWKVLFFETSAKNKINITESFTALVKKIIELKGENENINKNENENENKNVKINSRFKCSLF